MALVCIPDFKISKEKTEEELNKLVHALKPDWNGAKLLITLLTGGYSSDKYWIRPEDGSDVGVTIRVRRFAEAGKNIDELFFNPKHEMKAVKALSELKLFSTILAEFGNGYCYKYVEGKPIVDLTKPDETPLFNDYPLKGIFEKLAEIHSVKLEGEDYTKTDFFERVFKMLENNYNRKNRTDIVDKTTLKAELGQLLNLCNQHFKLNATLCHGDPHIGNVLWNKETGELTFMDWEGSHTGCQAYDLAYAIGLVHLNEVTRWPGFRDSPNPAETKKLCMKYYYDKWRELNHDDTERCLGEFEEFCKLMTLFSLVWHIVFAIVLGIVESKTHEMSSDFQADAGIPIITIIKEIYNHYQNIKEDVLRELNLS